MKFQDSTVSRVSWAYAAVIVFLCSYSHVLHTCTRNSLSLSIYLPICPSADLCACLHDWIWDGSPVSHPSAATTFASIGIVSSSQSPSMCVSTCVSNYLFIFVYLFCVSPKFLNMCMYLSIYVSIRLYNTCMHSNPLTAIQALTFSRVSYYYYYYY